jgi:uncharacterized peroxidase-related enzyme
MSQVANELSIVGMPQFWSPANCCHPAKLVVIPSEARDLQCFNTNALLYYTECDSYSREVLMARISLIETENATPEVKEIYEKTLRGKPGNVQKALAHRPEMLKAFLPFYASVGRSLDRKLYEMIYLRVSFINGCHYCEQHHVASSKRVGLTAEDWQALKNGAHSRFTEKEQTALAYAEKLTRASRDVTDADFEKLKKHFSDAEIVDLHLLVGLANLTNRFTDPLGLEVEFAEKKV